MIVINYDRNKREAANGGALPCRHVVDEDGRPLVAAIVFVSVAVFVVRAVPAPIVVVAAH